MLRTICAVCGRQVDRVEWRETTSPSRGMLIRVECHEATEEIFFDMRTVRSVRAAGYTQLTAFREEGAFRGLLEERCLR